MKRTFAKPFDYNCICQVCREKVKSSECTKRWDGLIVSRKHAGCFEHRSPLEMPSPPLREQRVLPFTSPDDNNATTGPACPLASRYSIAGVGVAGCMIAGFTTTGFPP